MAVPILVQLELGYFKWVFLFNMEWDFYCLEIDG